MFEKKIKRNDIGTNNWSPYYHRDEITKSDYTKASIEIFLSNIGTLYDYGTKDYKRYTDNLNASNNNPNLFIVYKTAKNKKFYSIKKLTEELFIYLKKNLNKTFLLVLNDLNYSFWFKISDKIILPSQVTVDSAEFKDIKKSSIKFYRELALRDIIYVNDEKVDIEQKNTFVMDSLYKFLVGIDWKVDGNFSHQTDFFELYYENNKFGYIFFYNNYEIAKKILDLISEQEHKNRAKEFKNALDDDFPKIDKKVNYRNLLYFKGDKTQFTIEFINEEYNLVEISSIPDPKIINPKTFNYSESNTNSNFLLNFDPNLSLNIPYIRLLCSNKYNQLEIIYKYNNEDKKIIIDLYNSMETYLFLCMRFFIEQKKNILNKEDIIDYILKKFDRSHTLKEREINDLKENINKYLPDKIQNIITKEFITQCLPTLKLFYNHPSNDKKNICYLILMADVYKSEIIII